MKNSSPAPFFFRSSSAVPPQPPRAGKSAVPREKPRSKSRLRNRPILPFRSNRKNNGRKTEVRTTEPYCPELNRNLTPAQIDSLVALWREKQALQSYDTFFNDYIDIDSLASSGDTTPDSVYANRLRALVSPVQLPFNPIVKTTSAVTSIPATERSTGY